MVANNSNIRVKQFEKSPSHSKSFLTTNIKKTTNQTPKRIHQTNEQH